MLKSSTEQSLFKWLFILLNLLVCAVDLFDNNLVLVESMQAASETA